MFLLDIALLGLTGACVFYCWSLSKRINDLQHNRLELARMMQAFDVATVDAEGKISRLESLSEQVLDKLVHNVQLAEEVSGSFEVLYTNLCEEVSKAGSLIVKLSDLCASAQRLDHSITSSYEKLQKEMTKSSDSVRSSASEPKSNRARSESIRGEFDKARTDVSRADVNDEPNSFESASFSKVIRAINHKEDSIDDDDLVDFGEEELGSVGSAAGDKKNAVSQKIHLHDIASKKKEIDVDSASYFKLLRTIEK